MRNRSVPEATVIPVLGYDDVVEAAEWLSQAFGFAVRLRIADHRVQLVHRDGAVIAIDGGAGSESTPSSRLQLLVEHELEDLGARPTP